MMLSLVGGGCLLRVEILRGLSKRRGGTAGWEEGPSPCSRKVCAYPKENGPKRALYIGVR